MAQFRAMIRGQRGLATRLGSKKSGLVGNLDGWKSGVMVKCSTDQDGRDRFQIWRTGGSNRITPDVLVAEWVGEEKAKLSRKGVA